MGRGGVGWGGVGISTIELGSVCNYLIISFISLFKLQGFES